MCTQPSAPLRAGTTTSGRDVDWEGRRQSRRVGPPVVMSDCDASQWLATIQGMVIGPESLRIDEGDPAVRVRAVVDRRLASPGSILGRLGIF